MTRNQRDLRPEEAVEKFAAKRGNKNTDKTVRSYENRLRQFVRWTYEIEEIETMRDLDGWLLDEYERFLDERGDAPPTVKGKMVALKELIKYCVQLEVVDASLPEKIDIPSLSKDEQTNDVKLDTADATRLFEHYRESHSDYGTVQHVLLEIIWHIGARTGGIRSLDLSDWNSESRVLQFRHRPPTRLKDGTEHERDVVLPETIADALDFYIERERPDKRDENGREPLLATRFGRPADSTIQTWAYQGTQPCVATACPHNRQREKCKYTEKSHASKCPSARSPHQIRTGSITWQLNKGLSYVKVAERVAASPETIRRYYDKADYSEQLERRRPDTEDLDIFSEDDHE
ncbi:phage integrase/site-specific recombinase [Halodesulfurarchaeum formicicum]|uniref:Phage integrase/site-specific recombinase n=1 Tax=Halodesulfurarchaeum formicicum TaxID=1873524 RepID=A0A1D8S440_9EURY|nr:site-specific integrase [Halodesulfurarchaeum formicicum]AOW80115.1 phage integrase/site-specific recombinase [Halodesulfurarchaeum formicicum]